MPLVEIPPPYRGPTHGEARIRVTGRSVRECLDAVESRYPGFATQIFDAQGKVHRFVKLYLNGEPVGAAELGRSVAEKDEVSVIAAIAGG